MKRNASRTVVSMDDAHDLAGHPGGQGEMPAAGTNGRARPVKDRWLSDLIRLTSGSEPYNAGPPVAGSAEPAESPNHIPDRLRQAVRWGYQEREFARFEQALSRRATFGDFLTWARERRGDTPDDLGQRAGLSADEVRALEAGRIGPLELAPQSVARLATALDASIWTLLERLQPESNGHTACAVADLLPAQATTPAVQAVWAAGAARRRERLEPLSLKPPTQSSRKKEDLVAYRRAVYLAWRDQQQC